MSNDGYKVGYKRPPRHTQFKPGQSGNPKGRPRGTKNLRTDLAEELAESITITEAGQQRVVSKQRGMLKSLFASAMKGNTSAARTLVNLIIGLEQVDSQERIAEGLTDDEHEVVEALMDRLRDQAGGEKDEPDA